VHPKLHTVVKQAEPMISRKYCPTGLQDLSWDGAYEIVHEVAATYDISKETLRIPKNRAYIDRRLKRLWSFLPTRCRGQNGIAIKDMVYN